MIDRISKIARNIFATRYPDALVMFLAGSIVRGESTPYSDLDLVVVFAELPNAYRESFYFQDFPIEAFVHDPDTLNYFFDEVDQPSGIPSLAQMVVEGIEVPEPSDISGSLKRLAGSSLKLGPKELTEKDDRNLRYAITNLINDIREPRSKDELTATGAELYESLANYFLRSKKLWSAEGKSIPRILKQANPELCLRYIESFDKLFVEGQPMKVITLAEEILLVHGGPLFDGHRLNAPAEYRKPLF